MSRYGLFNRLVVRRPLEPGQFRSRKFVRAINRHSMVGSMGRVGAAGDNAAMESFFALLQKNVLNRRAWATREQLRIAIVTWIEKTYHGPYPRIVDTGCDYAAGCSVAAWPVS